MLESAGAKLRPAVAVYEATGHNAGPAATGHSIVNCFYSQPRFHARIDGIADDSIAEHVLDRAHVQLALTGVMLGDIGQPQLVDCLSCEATFDEVITHRRAGLLTTFPGPFDRVREQSLPRTQSPHTTLRSAVAGSSEFISDEAISDTGGSSAWMS